MNNPKETDDLKEMSNLFYSCYKNIFRLIYRNLEILDKDNDWYKIKNFLGNKKIYLRSIKFLVIFGFLSTAILLLCIALIFYYRLMGVNKLTHNQDRLLSGMYIFSLIFTLLFCVCMLIFVISKIFYDSKTSKDIFIKIEQNYNDCLLDDETLNLFYNKNTSYKTDIKKVEKFILESLESHLKYLEIRQNSHKEIGNLIAPIFSFVATIVSLGLFLNNFQAPVYSVFPVVNYTISMLILKVINLGNADMKTRYKNACLL